MYRFTFLLLFFSAHSFAQTILDNHVKTLQSSASFDIKKKAYKEIDKLTYGKDHKAYITYANQFIDLAIENSEFDAAANVVIDLCSVYSSHLGQPDKALEAIVKILPYEDSIKRSRYKGNIYLKRAAYYYHGNDFTKAIEDYTTAINKFTQVDSIFIADAIFFRGQARSYSGDLLKSVKDYEMAIQYYEDLNDPEYVVNTKASLALLYSDYGFYDKANTIRDNYLTEAIKKEDYQLAGVTYFNKAIEALKQGDLDREERFLLKSEAFFDKLKKNKHNISLVYCKLSELYANTNQLAKAQKYLSKVESSIKILNNNKRIRYNYYNAKSVLEKAKKNYPLAIQFLKKGEFISGNWKNLKGQMHNQKLFYDLYKETGDKDKALTHFENYTALKDSIFSAEKTALMFYYQNLYELERKERNLKEQQADIALLEKANIIKTNWIIFGGVGLCVSFVFFFVIRSKRESERKKKLQEVYSQNLILAQENERKRIASELHDGLGQSLLLIKNHLINIDSTELKKLTNTSINEMRSIAMNLHPYQLQEFGLTKAILMNLKKFEQNSNTIFVSYEVDDLENLFNDIAEINIYRIIQECITNIIKHAQATAARFTLEKKSNSLKITVNDNGVGYNFQKSIHNTKSLGLKTLKERTRLLRGIMTVFSEKNEGSKIIFEIPIA